MELDRGLQKKNKSHTYIQIIFDKGSKIIQWRKDFPRPEKKILLSKQKIHLTKNEAGPFTHSVNKINTMYIKKV